MGIQKVELHPPLDRLNEEQENVVRAFFWLFFPVFGLCEAVGRCLML